MNKYNTIINDEIMQGDPLTIENTLKCEIANQILSINGNNYENTCENMRKTADIIELIENYINWDYITLKYNPMGSWYLDEEESTKILMD